MRAFDSIQQKKDLIKALAKDYKITKISVFGSVARNEDNENSDIDFLVDFEPSASLFELIGFKQAASEILNCSVDVATPNSLKERIKQRVLNEAIPL